MAEIISVKAAKRLVLIGKIAGRKSPVKDYLSMIRGWISQGVRCRLKWH